MEKNFDAMAFARVIMEEVITGYLMGITASPEDEFELALMLSGDAAHILIEKRLDGELSTMEWNATRNALTELIADLTK